MSAWRVYADPPTIDPAATPEQRRQRGKRRRRDSPFDSVLALPGRDAGNGMPGVADLAALLGTHAPSGIVVWLAGDVRWESFACVPAGGVCDILDVDGALPGPFEYDVVRLAVSLALVPGKKGQARDRIAAMAEGYQASVTALASEPLYSLREKARVRAERLRLPSAVSPEVPERRFISSRGGAPCLQPERLAGQWGVPVRRAVAEATREFAQYRETTSDATAAVLAGYVLADAVASEHGHVVVLLARAGAHDRLLLEARPVGVSPLEEALGAWRGGSDVHRVLQARDLLPLQPDPFAGWSTSADGAFGHAWGRMRQPAATKKVVTPGTREARAMGAVLGLIHARTGDATELAGYLGTSSTFAKALGAAVTSYTHTSRA